MNPPKRRRLDANASTLRKPFRSPLKVPIDDRASRRPSTASNLEQQRPDSLPSLAQRPPREPRTNELHSSHVRGTPTSTNNSCSNDDITNLQKRYSALAQELRKLKQDLDIAEQAQKLSSSTGEKQLESVTLRWRDIARSAADQVFELTNHRVKEMGGIRAWQKSSQQSSQSWFDHEVPQGNYETHEEQSTSTAGTRGMGRADKDEEQQEVGCSILIHDQRISNPRLANFHYEHNAPPDEHRSYSSRLR